MPAATTANAKMPALGRPKPPKLEPIADFPRLTDLEIRVARQDWASADGRIKAASERLAEIAVEQARLAEEVEQARELARDSARVVMTALAREWEPSDAAIEDEARAERFRELGEGYVEVGHDRAVELAMEALDSDHPMDAVAARRREAILGGVGLAAIDDETE